VPVHRNVRLIGAAALCRSLAIGLMGVTLGIYLAHAGYDAVRIGIVISLSSRFSPPAAASASLSPGASSGSS
jgi:hypothetical protein